MRTHPVCWCTTGLCIRLRCFFSAFAFPESSSKTNGSDRRDVATLVLCVTRCAAAEHNMMERNGKAWLCFAPHPIESHRAMASFRGTVLDAAVTQRPSLLGTEFSHSCSKESASSSFSSSSAAAGPRELRNICIFGRKV